MKVSMHLEVGESLYQEVILPKKQEKKFSSLLVRLLEGYRDNDGIRAYADGVDAPVDDLILRGIEDIMESALEGNMFSESASARVNAGKKSFETKDYSDAGEASDGEPGVTSSEDRLSRIEDSISKLTDLVSSLVGGVPPVRESTPVQKPVTVETPVKAPVVEPDDYEEEEIIVSLPDPDLEEVEEASGSFGDLFTEGFGGL